MSGRTIYVSVEELDASYEADGILYARLEATDGEPTGLKIVRDGFRSAIEKQRKPHARLAHVVSSEPHYVPRRPLKGVIVTQMDYEPFLGIIQ